MLGYLVTRRQIWIEIMLSIESRTRLDFASQRKCCSNAQLDTVWVQILGHMSGEPNLRVE